MCSQVDQKCLDGSKNDVEVIKACIVSSFLSALILEEIAIDTPIRQKEEEILKEAQELHLASLDLAR